MSLGINVRQNLEDPHKKMIIIEYPKTDFSSITHTHASNIQAITLEIDNPLNSILLDGRLW